MTRILLTIILMFAVFGGILQHHFAGNGKATAQQGSFEPIIAPEIPEGYERNTGEYTIRKRNGVVTISGALIPADEAPPPMEHADTPFFTYSSDPSAPRERRSQTYGTMDKVGIEDRVVEILSPEEMSIIDQLGSFSGDRDEFLTDSGHPPKLAVRFWRVVVDSALREPEDSSLSITVNASSGSAACGMCWDGIITEKWNLKNGRFTLVERNLFSGFGTLGPCSIDGMPSQPEP